MNLEFAAITYRSIRDRIRSEDPNIDEQTLADTVEGLTDLHEIVTAIIRSALADEALATGLKGRIAEMQDRLDRLQDRASKRRQIAKDVMVELDLKKITAPDFSVSIRPGLPSLMVIDEAAVPSIYWQPSAPRLKRQELLTELKDGAEIGGVTLSNPEPVLSVTGALMSFSAKQVQALRRNLDGRQIRTREANGRELSYIEGWFAISEANRIFGFDGWSRETVESRCVLARENRGTFVAVYVAKVRITVQADGATVVREGHGSGEGRGASPGEVHDISLKAAETDATKRAFATFGKPFGLELYRQSRTSGNLPTPKPAADAGAATRFGFHPDDTTPIPRPSRYYGRHQNPPLSKQLLSQPLRRRRSPRPCPRPPPAKSTKAFSLWPNRSAGAINLTCVLWPPSHASFADGSRAIPTICASRSRAHWVSKSATSSPCRSAGATTGNSIRPATKLRGGKASRSMPFVLPGSFGSKRIPMGGRCRGRLNNPKLRSKANDHRETDRRQSRKRKEKYRSTNIKRQAQVPPKCRPARPHGGNGH